MLDKFGRWYNRNYDAITWFLIGFMAMSFLDHLAKGDLGGMALDAIIIALNYYFVSRR